MTGWGDMGRRRKLRRRQLRRRQLAVIAPQTLIRRCLPKSTEGESEKIRKIRKEGRHINGKQWKKCLESNGDVFTRARHDSWYTERL